MPTLLVNGEHGVPEFLFGVEELHADLPQVSRVVVTEAGVFPLWEFPKRIEVLADTRVRFARLRGQEFRLCGERLSASAETR